MHREPSDSQDLPPHLLPSRRGGIKQTLTTFIAHKALGFATRCTDPLDYPDRRWKDLPIGMETGIDDSSRASTSDSCPKVVDRSSPGNTGSRHPSLSQGWQGMYQAINRHPWWFKKKTPREKVPEHIRQQEVERRRRANRQSISDLEGLFPNLPSNIRTLQQLMSHVNDEYLEDERRNAVQRSMAVRDARQATVEGNGAESPIPISTIEGAAIDRAEMADEAIAGQYSEEAYRTPGPTDPPIDHFYTPSEGAKSLFEEDDELSAYNTPVSAGMEVNAASVEQVEQQVPLTPRSTLFQSETDTEIKLDLEDEDGERVTGASSAAVWLRGKYTQKLSNVGKSVPHAGCKDGLSVWEKELPGRGCRRQRIHRRR